MKRALVLILALIIMVTLVSCGGKDEGAEKPIDKGQSLSEDSMTLDYFESDVVVNDFFVNYNNVATNKIEAEIIEKGNIDTKALFYGDDFNLEVINNNEYLAISIESNPENEQTMMFAVFSDCIKAQTDFSEDDIYNAWNDIHASGYLVENYEMKGLLITYVPSKELSWGVNNPRIDLKISIK